MITKMGYLFMFDIHSGKALYRAKISEQTIFVTTTQVPSLPFLPSDVRSGDRCGASPRCFFLGYDLRMISEVFHQIAMFGMERGCKSVFPLGGGELSEPVIPGVGICTLTM